jgi:hypothetical protein
MRLVIQLLCTVSLPIIATVVPMHTLYSLGLVLADLIGMRLASIGGLCWVGNYIMPARPSSLSAPTRSLPTMTTYDSFGYYFLACSISCYLIPDLIVNYVPFAFASSCFAFGLCIFGSWVTVPFIAICYSCTRYIHCTVFLCLSSTAAHLRRSLFSFAG